MEIENFIRNIGSNIKMIRTKRGLSQVDVAKQLGISKQAYSVWENNSKGMSIAKLYKVSKVLDCKITDFFIEI